MTVIIWSLSLLHIFLLMHVIVGPVSMMHLQEKEDALITAMKSVVFIWAALHISLVLFEVGNCCFFVADLMWKVAVILPVHLLNKPRVIPWLPYLLKINLVSQLFPKPNTNKL